MRFLAGLVAGILLLCAVGAVVVYGGRMSVAASGPPDMIDKVAPVARDKAVARQAAAMSLPTDPAAAARGMEHYGENCLPCHGAPGVKPMELAQGMNPAPPELDSPHTRALSDGEVFWIVKNGIRASGRPGFGVNHQDTEIQDIAAFVRHLPSLTTGEKQELAEALPHEHHHHDEGEAGGAEAGHDHDEGHGHDEGHAHAEAGAPGPHHH
jgi:mono/diheme cytochrome c family protein